MGAEYLCFGRAEADLGGKLVPLKVELLTQIDFTDRCRRIVAPDVVHRCTLLFREMDYQVYALTLRGGANGC